MTRRPSREEAFEAYRDLGKTRSLEKLHTTLAGSYTDPPCSRTLKSWSAAGSWRLRVHETEDLALALAAADGSPANRDSARGMHRIAFALMNKALKMATKCKDGNAQDAATIADAGIRIGRLALDVERGRPPSVERLTELRTTMAIAEKNKIVTLPLPSDPPPLKWSTLMYVIWHRGGPSCRGRDTNPKRL